MHDTTKLDPGLAQHARCTLARPILERLGGSALISELATFHGHTDLQVWRDTLNHPGLSAGERAALGFLAPRVWIGEWDDLPLVTSEEVVHRCDRVLAALVLQAGADCLEVA